MIVSGGQQGDSAIHIHVPILSSKGISWQERETPGKTEPGSGKLSGAEVATSRIGVLTPASL